MRDGVEARLAWNRPVIGAPLSPGHLNRASARKGNEPSQANRLRTEARRGTNDISQLASRCRTWGAANDHLGGSRQSEGRCGGSLRRLGASSPESTDLRTITHFGVLMRCSHRPRSERVLGRPTLRSRSARAAVSAAAQFAPRCRLFGADRFAASASVGAAERAKEHLGAPEPAGPDFTSEPRYERGDWRPTVRGQRPQ
jgi:hypothetical protein